MKSRQTDKSRCRKCNKISIMTTHTPVMRASKESVIKEPKIDFIEKMYCLKCGKEIK